MPNDPPVNDGEINEYVNANAASTQWFDRRRKVVFVNGMLNSPDDHADSAVALSMLQMCKVIGIYNHSNVANPRPLSTARAVVEDLHQCIGDKLRWDGGGIDRIAVNIHSWYQSSFGSTAEAVQYVELWLRQNRAALSLFRHLLRNIEHPQTVFAHSQGNLITSNALTGLYLLDPGHLRNITVNSYASPSFFWPSGFSHNRYAYTLDLVPLVAGMGNSLDLRTSTIGGPSGVLSHGFENYRRDDATFVVNRFRVGMLRMTAHMDENGLARALFDMGTNMPRVYNIFGRLDEVHNSDVDDVALAYIERLRSRPDLIMSVRNHPQLRALLIRSLDEGYTSDREYAAIRLIS